MFVQYEMEKTKCRDPRRRRNGCARRVSGLQQGRVNSPLSITLVRHARCYASPVARDACRNGKSAHTLLCKPNFLPKTCSGLCHDVIHHRIISFSTRTLSPPSFSTPRCPTSILTLRLHSSSHPYAPHPPRRHCALRKLRRSLTSALPPERANPCFQEDALCLSVSRRVAHCLLDGRLENLQSRHKDRQYGSNSRGVARYLDASRMCCGSKRSSPNHDLHRHTQHLVVLQCYCAEQDAAASTPSPAFTLQRDSVQKIEVVSRCILLTSMMPNLATEHASRTCVRQMAVSVPRNGCSIQCAQAGVCRHKELISS